MAKRHAALIAVLAVLIAFAGFGQDGTADVVPEGETILLSDFLTYNVVSPGGEETGKVEDIIIDLSAGFVTHIVFSFEPLEPAGGNLYPIPVTAVLRFARDSSFLLDIDPDVLENAPTLNRMLVRDDFTFIGRGRAFDMFWFNVGILGTEVVTTNTETYPQYRYGAGMDVQPETLVRFSTLTEREIATGTGTESVSIEDCVVDTGLGTILAVIVRSGDAPRLVPLGVFTVDLSNNAMTIDYGSEYLSGAPRFEDEALGAEGWETELARYWNGVNPAINLRLGVRGIPGAVVTAGELTGYNVTNLEGEALGTIVDLIVLSDGQHSLRGPRTGEFSRIGSLHRRCGRGPVQVFVG